MHSSSRGISREAAQAVGPAQLEGGPACRGAGGGGGASSALGLFVGMKTTQ